MMNIELSGLEVSLVNVMSRELVMRSYMERVKDRYDYILIGCMPSLGMITINAFACADSIPMSVRAAETSAEGISIHRYGPKGRVAGAYQSLTEEVLHDE